MWPAYVAIACFLFRIARIVYHLLWFRHKITSEGSFKTGDDNEAISGGSYFKQFKRNFKRLGAAITIFRSFRLLGILLLIVINVQTLGRNVGHQTSQVETIHLVLYASDRCPCCSYKFLTPCSGPSASSVFTRAIASPFFGNGKQ